MTLKKRENLKNKKNRYPRCSIVTTDKVFLNTDNGSMCGTHWIWFYEKINHTNLIVSVDLPVSFFT